MMHLRTLPRPFAAIVALFAAPEPTPAKPRKTRAKPAPKNRTIKRADDLDRAKHRAQGLKLHRAPAGDDVPRYSPQGFGAPVWSIADLERIDGRKFSKATGKVMLIDGRKAWQKEALSSNFDRTGSIHTWKRTPKT